MTKSIAISFIFIVNLYSNDIATKYYLDYKDNDIIKTAELTEEKYLKTKYNLDFYKNTSKKVKWTYNKGKDYDILRVYKIDPEPQKDIKKEVIVETQINEKKDVAHETLKETKSKNIENEKSYFLHIILLILIIYFIKKIKNKNNIKYEEQAEIKEEQKRELLDYINLEKTRLEIYNDLKYNKNIEKEEKKKLYKKINQLKTEIKNKEDLEKLNNDLHEIKKGAENERD